MRIREALDRWSEKLDHMHPAGKIPIIIGIVIFYCFTFPIWVALDLWDVFRKE